MHVLDIWSEPASSLILNSESLRDKVRLKLRLFLYFTRGAFVCDRVLLFVVNLFRFKTKRNCVDFIIYDLVHHVLC